MKFALLTIALATAQLVAAQRAAMRVPPDETEQYYLVSFDQNRASAKDVERSNVYCVGTSLPALKPS